MITVAPQHQMVYAALQGDDPMTDHPDAPDAVRGRATSLFQYLAALVELRTKMVRDCGSCERVFWVGDLPREPECQTLAWSDADGDGVWLRIEKPAKPVLPEPPEECKPWLDRAALTDPTQQPSLYKEVIDPEWSDPHTASEEDAETPSLQLEDFPNLVDAWETYLERQWLPWREQHKRWERVQTAYRQLFGIYQQQRRRGEQFELVFGVGTLLWKNNSGHRVRRPVITAQATISLESVSGSITVEPAAEGARFSLEQDMLEVEERPPVEDQRQYETQVGNLETLGNQKQVFEILKRWVNTLPVADAEFSDALSCPEQATKTPKMVFAPVLMLRRHSGQTLRSAIRKALGQLQDTTTIPLGIREVCGDFAHRQNSDGTPASNKHFQVPEELLFPLPTNDEQADIVQRLNGHPGILVQGPPGTGKSHTIANLICHFLAHGKRILVTSQTPRALKVLHDKLPPRLRGLCVSVLGSDQVSLRSLEQSVHGILSEVNAWNSRDSEQEILRITQERRACLSEIAHLRRLQREVREAETVEHFVANSPYHGTPQKIAQRLEADHSRYSWFADDIPEDAECPMSSQELAELAGLRANLGPDDFALPNLEIPDPDALPSAVEFQREATTLLEAQSAASRLGERATTPRVLGLSQVGEEVLRRLADQTQECCEIRNALAWCAESWVRSAGQDILGGNHHSWVTLHNYTRESLDYLGKFPVDTPLTVRTPPKIDESQLLGDSRDLLQHFKSGKGLGFWGFRAPVVKRCQYLWQSYRFNGRLCNSTSALQALVDHLELLFGLRRVWREWSGHCNPPSGLFRQHLELLANCQRVLGRALRMHELAEAAGDTLSSANCPTPNLLGENWASELLEDVKAACVIRGLTAAKSRVDEVIAPLLTLREHSLLHDAVSRLINAAETLAVDDYPSALESVEEIWEARKLAGGCLALDGRLRAAAPKLATALEDENQREAFTRQLETFEEAWGWKRAIAWLRRFTAESDDDLDGRIATVEKRLSRLTEELVALRAWQSCNEHLSQDHHKQGALQAWQQIMRRIGRGTGKHVETHRRDARKYMDECRDAIPAWIMPLHRVAETVEMKPGAFDIVIVDEASQTGPEGLILQYIGKQCIIVGDDKQISPEAVGTNMNAVRSLMEQYLVDFPYAETLAPTSSLFDQATIRYGGNRVTLRKHFRCMPEIIRFSNDLCYSDTPLIPLRQYPPKRLEPIVVRHVVDGYREGQRNRVINRPEAAAVAKTVIDCLNDPRYAGKTMGVICLQGHAQAQLIEHLLLDAVGPKPFEERELICGDAYSFQGDERDIIFMSMVAAVEGQGRYAALVRETFRQRFNVAASRARDQVWLFHSVQRNDLNPECMRRQLLEHYYSPATEALSQDLSVCESQFERDVATQLISRGYRVIPQYPYAGKRIDLVIEGAKSRLAIECDGDEWHGPDRYEADMQRQRLLERAGWKFVRVRGSGFYANRQTEVTRLLTEIEAQGIEPVANGDMDDADCSYIGEVRGQGCLKALGVANVSDPPDPSESASPDPDQDRSADESSSDESTEDPDDKDADEESDENDGNVETSQSANDSFTSPERQRVLPFAESDSRNSAKVLIDPHQPNEPSEERQTIAEIVAHGSEAWLRLAHWARVNDQLEPRERSLAYSVGDRIRREAEPSFPQARWAKTILEKAIEVGFDLSGADSKQG